MKQIIKNIILLLVITNFLSCRTKDGAPGPAGTNGTNGTNGASNLINQGSISGTLYYLDYLGDSAKIPFNYQYYGTLQNNQFQYTAPTPGNVDAPYGYGINLSRQSEADAEDLFTFNIANGNGSLNKDNTPATPSMSSSSYGSNTLSFSLTELLNNNLFSFSASPYWGDTNSGYTISNFSLDTLSGQLQFDYNVTFSSSDISNSGNSNPAIIKGTVNVILARNRTPIELL